MKIQPIARIEKPSLKTFQQEFVKGDRPVIICGVAKDWSACKQWNPKTLKSMFGSVMAPLRGSDNELEVFFGEARQKSVMSIAEYLDLIESIPPNGKRPPYLGNIPFDDPLAKPYLDSIRSQIQFPNYFPENRGSELRLWIGATEQKSTIHNDNYHNLNAQIYGQKAFLLLSPEQHQSLYAVKIDDGLWSSPIDPQQPDWEKYPRFREAIGLEGVLHEGEILFIPAFWWHQARGLTTSINVNMWVYTDDVSRCYENSRFWQVSSAGR